MSWFSRKKTKPAETARARLQNDKSVTVTEIDLTRDYCLRGKDRHGFGHFGASRGSRRHRGIDVISKEHDIILSCSDGKISKIGYPYSPSDETKGHLRYVEVLTDRGAKERYFYCLPVGGMKVGTRVKRGQPVAVCQDLVCIYGGITPHMHFEVKAATTGGYGIVDPTRYLECL